MWLPEIIIPVEELPIDVQCDRQAYKAHRIHHWKMETSDPNNEDVEWQRVKAAILRIDQTTREINHKLSHLIEYRQDDAYAPEPRYGTGRSGPEPED